MFDRYGGTWVSGFAVGNLPARPGARALHVATLVRRGITIARIASLLRMSRAGAASLARRGEQFLGAVCGGEDDVAANTIDEHEDDHPPFENTMELCERPAACVDGPLYTPKALGRYLLLPVATVRRWTLGSQSSRALIHSAAWDENLLSFRNACEVHVLSAFSSALLRPVPFPILSIIVQNLQQRWSTTHPLADVRMRGEGKELVADELRRAGLVAPADSHVARTIEAYVARIERDDRGEPLRLRVCTRGPYGPEHIALDAAVHAGKPCITGTRVATASLWEQFKSGTSLRCIVEKAGCSWEALEEVVRYETSGL